MAHIALSRDEIIARNVQAIDAHFAHENLAVALYTDDIFG
jgi:hypothetical protein